jgi:hypothetical protein
MGSAIKLKCKNKIVRGTLKELKRYCKNKNIALKRIRQDDLGYYLKAWDRNSLKSKK